MRSRVIIVLIIFCSCSWADTNQTRAACVPLLSASGVSLRMHSQRLESDNYESEPNNWRDVYLSLLNLVLEGIDEIGSHAFGHADRALIKVQLLEKLAAANAPTNPLNDPTRPAIEGRTLHSGTPPPSRNNIANLTNFSSKLSTLADSGQFEIILDNLNNNDWQKIRQAAQQKLEELQNLQVAQKIAKPTTQDDFVDVPNHLGETRLHRLMATGTPEEILKLIRHPQITAEYLNTPNEDRQTPFSIFVKRLVRENHVSDQHKLIYRELKTKGAEVSDDLDNAIAYASIPTLKTLIELGADVNEKKPGALNPPIFQALYTSNVNRAVIEILVSAGANTTIQDQDGITPFAWAIYATLDNVLDLLFTPTMDLNTLYNKNPNEFLYSLMHVAASRGNLASIQFLYDKGADINIEDTLERTPLYYAARDIMSETKAKATINLLLKLGARLKKPKRYDPIYEKLIRLVVSS